MATQFYQCPTCKTVVMALSKEIPPSCCNVAPKAIKPGEVEAATEKHKPVIDIDGRQVTVSVGSIAHPATPEHYIEWVVLETTQGRTCKTLGPTVSPKAIFALLPDETVIGAYAYCNLHGLWD